MGNLLHLQPDPQHAAGLVFAPAALILTIGVFADMLLVRHKNPRKRDDECCEDCTSDPLFITAWVTLLFSAIYAVLAACHHFTALVGNEICGLSAASEGVFIVSRVALYLHFIARNHTEQQSKSDISSFRCVACGTAVVTTAVAVIYAWLASNESLCQKSAGEKVLFVCLDVIYTSYIMYLVWGFVRDIRSPRRISRDDKYVMVQQTVVFSIGALISWMMLVVVVTVFPPIGLIVAAFNTVYTGLLFEGNEKEYEKWCCCHSCVWDCGNTSASLPRAVASGTSDKSRSSREGMMIEMTAGGEGTTAGNAEMKKVQEEYVD